MICSHPPNIFHFKEVVPLSSVLNVSAEMSAAIITSLALVYEVCSFILALFEKFSPLSFNQFDNDMVNVIFVAFVLLWVHLALCW